MPPQSAQLTEETRRIVERYDSALRQIALLKSENRSLKESMRMNEVKVLRLINHYQQDIEERTNTITRLHDERRAQEMLETRRRQKQYSDQSTEIGEGDFNAREAELEQIIHVLEDEIDALKESHRLQQEDFERQTLHNEALARKSFENNIGVLRRLTTDEVSAEVADTISQLLRDNKGLSKQFREVLNEMERLQESRENLSKDLVRTRRELGFMKYKEKMLEEKLEAVAMSKQDACAQEYATDEAREAKTSDTIEEYFKESLRLCNVR